MEPSFRNRREAGQLLAARLSAYAGRPDVIVLGLPRGGVPVAFEVARALAAPLDVLIVRKLGLPGHEELAMGAIASGGIRVINPDVVGDLTIPAAVIDDVSAAEQRVLEQREHSYRANRPALDVRERTVMLIDDGLATGATMYAAICAVRLRHAAKVIVAIPVAAAPSCAALEGEVDELVCLMMPQPFVAVGLWYNDFTATTDDEVRELLAQAAAQVPADDPLPVEAELTLTPPSR